MNKTEKTSVQETKTNETPITIAPFIPNVVTRNALTNYRDICIQNHYNACQKKDKQLKEYWDIQLKETERQRNLLFI